MKDARDRVQRGGEAVFEGAGGTRRAAGTNAIRHDAHGATAGDDALPHFHPVDSRGKKKSGHAFIKNATQKVVIPGATAGTALLGDNLLGATADFFNPLGDVQDVFEVMETTVIPTIFGFVDEYLMRPPSPPEETAANPDPENTEQQTCLQDQECSTGQ
jgi:hypothetical protein